VKITIFLFILYAKDSILEIFLAHFLVRRFQRIHEIYRESLESM
jgi:hypothetical protein